MGYGHSLPGNDTACGADNRPSIHSRRALRPLHTLRALLVPHQAALAMTATRLDQKLAGLLDDAAMDGLVPGGRERDPTTAKQKEERQIPDALATDMRQDSAMHWTLWHQGSFLGMR
jgi:hypothetical protein